MEGQGAACSAPGAAGGFLSQAALRRPGRLQSLPSVAGSQQHLLTLLQQQQQQLQEKQRSDGSGEFFFPPSQAENDEVGIDMLDCMM